MPKNKKVTSEVSSEVVRLRKEVKSLKQKLSAAGYDLVYGLMEDVRSLRADKKDLEDKVAKLRHE